MCLCGFGCKYDLGNGKKCGMHIVIVGFCFILVFVFMKKYITKYTMK